MRLIECVARLSAGTYLALAIAGCDSTAPGHDVAPFLRIQGQVLQADQPAIPPLDLDIQAWFGSDGSDSAAVRTDPDGRYAADLGPISPPYVDSLRVRVHQYD